MFFGILFSCTITLRLERLPQVVIYFATQLTKFPCRREVNWRTGSKDTFILVLLVALTGMEECQLERCYFKFCSFLIFFHFLLGGVSQANISITILFWWLLSHKYHQFKLTFNLIYICFNLNNFLLSNSWWSRGTSGKDWCCQSFWSIYHEPMHKKACQMRKEILEILTFK